MDFVSGWWAGWLAVGAAAAAIPVVIHLIHTARAPEVPFPTLRFLKSAAERTARRRRLENLLLMILRMLLFAILAVALARPFLASEFALFGEEPETAAVLVLDNSASMNVRHGPETRFARAKAADYGGDPERVTLVGHSAGGAVGLGGALGGDDLGPLWDTFASARGGPPPQVDCLADGASAYPEAFVGYGGAYPMLEFLKEDDPELWELASPYALAGGNPELQVRFIHGEWDSMIPAEGVELSRQLLDALADAGYNATWTTVDAGHQFSPTGPTGELVVQMILEAARD